MNKSSKIEFTHLSYIFFFEPNNDSMNIKIQKVNSNEIYENTYTLKKLQKTKVFSNKKKCQRYN